MNQFKNTVIYSRTCRKLTPNQENVSWFSCPAALLDSLVHQGLCHDCHLKTDHQIEHQNPDQNLGPGGQIF